MNEEEQKTIKEFYSGLHVSPNGIILDTVNYRIYKILSKLQKENEELKETLKCTQNSWYGTTYKLDRLQKELEQEEYIIHLTDKQYRAVIDKFRKIINGKLK